HVLRAQAAIVGAAPALFGIETFGQLRWLDENLAALTVVLGIIGQQHTLAAMPWAPFFQIDARILDQDFRLDATQALRAHGHGAVVEKIRPYLGTHDDSPRDEVMARMMRGTSRA